ncbi:hypothetical protein, partial [Staphylococcus aureus]
DHRYIMTGSGCKDDRAYRWQYHKQKVLDRGNFLPTRRSVEMERRRKHKPVSVGNIAKALMVLVCIGGAVGLGFGIAWG